MVKIRLLVAALGAIWARPPSADNSVRAPRQNVTKRKVGLAFDVMGNPIFLPKTIDANDDVGHEIR